MKATDQRLARRIHLALCSTLITNPELFRGKTRTFIVISFSLQRNYTETISFIALFQYNVVLLHCGCLSLNPFIEFSIWNNSSSSDMLNIQASISPKYESQIKDNKSLSFTVT